MHIINTTSLKMLLKLMRNPYFPFREDGNCYSYYIYIPSGYDIEECRRFLLLNIKFPRVEKEIEGKIRWLCLYWLKVETNFLADQIEKYLNKMKENNPMIDTILDPKNTKFYAVVTDKETEEKTCYEIGKIPDLELTAMHASCNEPAQYDYVLNFTNLELRKATACDSCANKNNGDKIKELETQNDNYLKRIKSLEEQLRCAMDRLDVYENTDHTFTVFDRTKNQKKAAEDIRDNLIREAAIEGASSAKDLKLLGFELTNDCIERIGNSTVNSWSLSHPRAGFVKVDTDAIYYMDTSGFVKSIYYNNGMRNGKMKTLSEMMAKRRLNSMYGEYCANDVKATKETFEHMKSWALEWNSNGETTPHIKINVYDSIKDVKFANPATIVFWKDGTKTVVKAQGDEQYIPEVGLAMCICKKVMGNTRDYYRVFKHWMKRAPKED